MTKTKTLKAHTDGGTYTTIAFAETINGWGISITRWTTYRGAVRFEVNRVSDDNKTLRLDHFATESEARTYANQMWKQDR
jgi:hypothetical protein